MYIHCEDCDATSAFSDNKAVEGNILALTKEVHCVYCQSTNFTFYDVVDDNVDEDFNFIRCPICNPELEGSKCINCSKKLPPWCEVIIA